MFLSTWMSKLPENIARLSLILHVMGKPAETIGQETMEKACAMGDLFFAHAKQIHFAMDPDEGADVAQKVWNWIDVNRSKLRKIRVKEDYPLDHDTVKPKDLYIFRAGGIKTPDEARNVLELLHYRKLLHRAKIRSASNKMHDCYLIRPAEALA
jgi:hypothetical protein